MNGSKTILIGGGTGLIGNRLTQLLHQKGYEVNHLSRDRKNGKVKTFLWNIEKGQIDLSALKNVSAIINLTGAGVFDRRWTIKRKREILESRTSSTALIFHTLKNNSHEVKTFVSASAVGYYGSGPADKVFTEDDKPGIDFLADVTVAWESEADKFTQLGIRTVKVRLGVVLSPEGGALAPIVKAVKFWLGSPLGSGEQYMSWIHIDDACRAFIHAIEHGGMEGSYNAVAPMTVTNRELTESIARIMKKPMIFPKVPAFFLKLVFGEMASFILGGAKVSSHKIVRTGFKFQFPDLNTALVALLNEKKQ